MRQIPILIFTLLLVETSDVFSQKDKQITKNLVNTWYAVKVGASDGAEMNPTSRKEVFIFNSDGTLIIKDGDMEIPGKWEYLGKSKLKAAISFKGIEKEAELTIRELSKDKLVLVDPGNDKTTEYSTTPPDPNAPKPRTAPVHVGSDSNYEVDKWTGLHPFNKKLITAADGTQEKVDAVGVVILLMINDRKTLRINDDGLTTDIEVSGGSEIAGQKHFGFVTDDPDLAGEVVFGNEGFYVYKDKDQSTVEYLKE